MIIHYNENLKNLSRELRKNSPCSEVLLWNQLKSGKIKGYKFTRQKPIENYIVDFYSKKLKLVIEIDGITHNEKRDEDKLRQEKLESKGLSVLRFIDEDVRKNMAGVLQVIETWINNYEKNNLL